MKIFYRRPKLLLIASLGVLAAIILAAVFFRPTPQESDRSNVILVVVDTLRADHLGSYGYPKDTSPRLDRLAEESILFENTIAQAPWTIPSMGSLFTSTYPHNHGAMSNMWQPLPKKVLTLAEVLRDRGYRTMAVQTNPILSKPFHFNQGFADYEELLKEDLTKKLTIYRAEEVVDNFLKWADKNRRHKFFAYLHLMDCHLPFHPSEEDRLLFERSYQGHFLPDQITYEDRFDILDSTSQLSTADKEHIVALYDASVHYVDAQIGRLIDGLSDRGILDRTLLIVTSDHGEEFFERGSFGHGQSLYNELLRVPLLLRYPVREEKGVRIRQQVRLIDLFPTILSFLHIRLPEGLVGTDLTPLLSDPQTDRQLAAYSEGVSFTRPQPGKTAQDFIGIQKGGYKLIRQMVYGREALEFYDLRKDPKELSPLSEDPVLVQEYKTLLDEHQDLGGHLQSPRLSESEENENLKKLRSLGYIH